MKLATPLNALKNVTSDIWRLHDLNYKLPKEAKQDYWDKEFIDHPTSANCKVYKFLLPNIYFTLMKREKWTNKQNKDPY